MDKHHNQIPLKHGVDQPADNVDRYNSNITDKPEPSATYYQCTFLTGGDMEISNTGLMISARRDKGPGTEAKEDNHRNHRWEPSTVVGPPTLL